MTAGKRRLLTATLVLAMMACGRYAPAQTAPHRTEEASAVSQLSPLFNYPLAASSGNLPTANAERLVPGYQPDQLFEFNDAEIKFNLRDLMSILRDHQHEGWVLAAYPDPKTSRPLIGAGFSLDVPATEHLQHDPLNPNHFVEPSSAQLWQAAGLDPERLQGILDQFDRDLKAWSKKKYRKKINRQTLPPQLSEAEATALLRISAIQAVENARAYCRNFDQLTASQQMALSQLVFQMGVNLEQFVEFLSALNGDNRFYDLSRPDSDMESEGEHWKTVQNRLIDSQWATRYTTRATAVIAMFDPRYAQDPMSAKLSVEAVLTPPVKPARKKPAARSLHVKYESGHRPGNKNGAGSRHKSKLT